MEPKHLALLMLAGALWLAGYFVACWWWPFVRSCWRCSGEGKLDSPGGKAFRVCPRCKGNPVRRRFGRWLWVKMRG